MCLTESHLLLTQGLVDGANSRRFNTYTFHVSLSDRTSATVAPPFQPVLSFQNATLHPYIFQLVVSLHPSVVVSRIALTVCPVSSQIPQFLDAVPLSFQLSTSLD